MKIDKTFLRSKVARRIFMLFISCALLPIAVLAILSFTHVTKQLNQQSQRRLHQASKAMGMTLLERVLFLEAEMKMMISSLNPEANAIFHQLTGESGDRIREKFEALALVTGEGERTVILGHVNDPPPLSEAETKHLTDGKTLVTRHSYPDESVHILLRRLLDTRRPERGLLLAEVNTGYLWGNPDMNPVPPMTELSVLDRSGKILFSSFEGPVSFPEQVKPEMTTTKMGFFDWKYEDTTYVARYRSVALRYHFLEPKWIVVLSVPKSHVLAPMAKFKRIFPLVVLLASWVVLLLSIMQIRKSLVPLEKLQEGTRRIAGRDFDTRVNVTSGDEFEDLATAFNSMAGRLGKQFNTMATMNEIDRSILSSLDTRKIVDTVIGRMNELFPCDGVGVAMLDRDAPGEWLMYIQEGDYESKKRIESVMVTPTELQELIDHPEQLLLETGDGARSYLTPLGGHGDDLFIVLPMFVDERLSGMIVSSYFEPAKYDEEDGIQSRQLADQVAVAISNARLMENLEELNWGTLYALARAIDAKSHWTAGHSERVTKLALEIGRVMGLSKKELENLHRGGLLHDIGKIGIPPEILDKDGKLSDEEFKMMKEHVRIGARILEPIEAYASVIPVVLQHHESYDGSGYPDGLAGEEISLGARIFCVADVVDALISDRPYRAGMERETVINIIREGSGTKYDPQVVKSFMKVMGVKAEEESGEELKASAVQAAS
jgi:putative nucleotidyltransferase with HDIG domain